jgi:hypothetical protein
MCGGVDQQISDAELLHLVNDLLRALEIGVISGSVHHAPLLVGYQRLPKDWTWQLTAIAAGLRDSVSASAAGCSDGQEDRCDEH